MRNTPLSNVPNHRLLSLSRNAAVMSTEGIFVKLNLPVTESIRPLDLSKSCGPWPRVPIRSLSVCCSGSRVFIGVFAKASAPGIGVICDVAGSKRRMPLCEPRRMNPPSVSIADTAFPGGRATRRFTFRRLSRHSSSSPDASHKWPSGAMAAACTSRLSKFTFGMSWWCSASIS